MTVHTQGERLLMLRKAKKLTQQQLADKIKVSKTSITYWEQDKSTPKLESLEGLCKELGTTIEYILHGTIEDNKNLNSTEQLAQRIIQLLNEGILSHDDINLINNTTQSFVEHLVKLKESTEAVANGTAPDKKSA